MRHNYKFHAVALTVICTFITVLFFLLTPKKQPAIDPALQGTRYIQVYSASWGLNCDFYLQEAMRLRATAPAQKNEKGEIIKQSPLVEPTPNNVLSVISEGCNGKLTCDIDADSEVLGIEPLETCPKKLEIGYRCYSYDRIRTKTAQQGQTLSIDCNEHADKTPTAGNPASAQ